MNPTGTAAGMTDTSRRRAIMPTRVPAVHVADPGEMLDKITPRQLHAAMLCRLCGPQPLLIARID